MPTSTVPPLPTVYLHPRTWRGSLADTRQALDQWFETTCRTDLGLRLGPHEIYWLSYIGPTDGLVDASSDCPPLAVGLKPGDNEGWILMISANVKESHSGGVGSTLVPIALAKVWTATAGCALAVALMEAALGAFQPDPRQALTTLEALRRCEAKPSTST